MNCPYCDGKIDNAHWVADPPLPVVLVPTPAGDPPRDGGPATTSHELITWCEFCQLAAVVQVTCDRIGGRLAMGRVRGYANAKDVKRLLARLPIAGAGVKFVRRGAGSTGRRRRTA